MARNTTYSIATRRTMTSGYGGLSWLGLLFVAGLGLSQPLDGTHRRAQRDLDSLTDQQLRYYINGELDDIYGNPGGANKVLSACDAYEELMDALSDDGDDDDADSIDDVIDESDLEAEMEEDGTSLSDQVEEALGAQCGGGDAGAPAHGPRVHEASLDRSAAPPVSRARAVASVTTKLIKEIRKKAG